MMVGQAPKQYLPLSLAGGKSAMLTLVAGVLSFTCCGAVAAQDDLRVDILLRGGVVFDGTLVDPQVQDVAIRDGRIVVVGEFSGRADRVFDCRNLVVAPGFIDLHNHSDSKIVSPEARANVNFLMQGCTTVVTGNCGSGPIRVAEYYDKIDAAGAGTNVVHLLPHNSLRTAAMGQARRSPTDDELSSMRQNAERAMQEGAWGMSTGLIYVPGAYAETDELVAITQVVARHDGIYASHIRNESAGLLDAVAEAIEIGHRAGLPVHVSHFKAVGRPFWGSVRIAARMIEDARTRGERVTADQYPYIASSTSLGAMTIPAWARAGGRRELLRRLDDPQLAERIRKEMAELIKVRDHIRIARYNPRPDWLGQRIRDIAQAEGKETIDLIIDIERRGGAAAVNFGMDEEDVRFVMQLPWVATASDGRADLPGADRPHPRLYGTFPRKVGYYAYDQKVISPVAAIHSASGLPADILGLEDRGYLRPKMAADIVVFDPDNFRDRATFDDPQQYAAGVRYVFVNGRPAVFAGIPTGALAGRALRHTAASTAAAR